MRGISGLGTAIAAMLVCRCGHVRAAHQHHRRGSDCALCPGTCPRFRPHRVLARSER
ncbi:hypothetical protein [Nocardioides dongkuii]|uniref:hypothetical protein n=1 Tax=Nocardioides dongkuii TaxID=2760089 RepID=UPI0015FAC408|nr:hypothetical protein [Nocardioides dongkuii]